MMETSSLFNRVGEKRSRALHATTREGHRAANPRDAAGRGFALSSFIRTVPLAHRPIGEPSAPAFHRVC
jgi:hypothetical protein